MKKGLILMALVILVISATLIAAMSLKKESPEQKRIRIINELSEAISELKAEGVYNCCIEPPCTMCYLGDWIWKDGICRCDDMIAKGEFDKVCPQCKKGIEEGSCSSTVSNKEYNLENKERFINES